MTQPENQAEALKVVKALEWKQVAEGGIWEVSNCQFAWYKIVERMTKDGFLQTWNEGRAATLDEAKAAAQADFEARIRSALQSSPPVQTAAVDGEVRQMSEEEAEAILDANPELREKVGAVIDEMFDEDINPLDIAEYWMKRAHIAEAALASQPAVEGDAVACWQVWVEPGEDEAIVTGWVDEDADMIEHWRSKGRRVRPLYTRHAAADAGVREALVNLAHEMRFLLRQNPDKDGGLYRQRLDEADAALALAKGECPHRCDEGGVCLAEHSGFPQSCPRAALSLAAKRGLTNG